MAPKSNRFQFSPLNSFLLSDLIFMPTEKIKTNIQHSMPCPNDMKQTLPTYSYLAYYGRRVDSQYVFFYKIEPKRKETKKKIVKVSCFNFAGIQQSILLILSSLDPHFQALTDSVISLGYSPLNPLPFPYCTVWTCNMSFFVPLGFLLELLPNKISVQLGLWTLIFHMRSILVIVKLSRQKQINK